MPPRLIIAAAAVLVFTLGSFLYSYNGAGAQTSQPQGAPKYNVILIVADDVGVDLVNVYASDYEVDDEWLPCTPELDELANKGVRFTNAWSSASCSPSRAMIMTGRLPSTTGIGGVVNADPGLSGLDETFFTLGNLAKDADAFFGKWHLGDKSQWPSHPIDCGFDQFAGTRIGTGPNYSSWDEWTGANCEVDDPEEYSTRHITQHAKDFIAAQGAAPANPWFLMVSYHAVHSPFHCPPNMPPMDECPQQPGCVTDFCGCGPGSSKSQKVRAMMQAMDYHIGEIEDELVIQGVDDKTVIIFVGDNGTPGAAVELPWNKSHAKGSMYQGGINVPLIIRPPSGIVPADDTKNELVSITDILETVADFLGERDVVPTEILEKTSSLRFWVDGTGAPDPRDHVFSERFTPNFRNDGDGSPPNGHRVEHQSGHSRAIRNDKFKLIEEYKEGVVERRMYSLHRPDLPGEPLPHDPAILDDHPDTTHSAFEKKDIYGDQTYSADRYALETLLSDEYGSLFDNDAVVALVTATQLKTATEITPLLGGPSSYQCSDSVIEVGYEPMGSDEAVHRTFMEFILSGVEGNLLAAFLDVGVINGTLDYVEITVEGRNALQDVSSFDITNPTQCTNLWSNAGPSIYDEAFGWVCAEAIGAEVGNPVRMAFSLEDEVPLIQAAIDQNGRFSIALTSDDENNGSFAGLSNLLSDHRLRLVIIPPAGGGCPYVYVFDGEEFVETNTILGAVDARSAGRHSANITDAYVLQTAPAVVDGRYQIEIREFENEHSYIDRVRLYEVDHPEDTELVVTDGGELIAYNERMLPTTAADARGTDLLETLSHEDDVMFHGKAGDEVVLTYRASSSRDVGIIAFSEEKTTEPPLPTSGGITAGIEAFVRLPGADRFESLGAFTPRERRAPAPLLIPPRAVQPGDDLVMRLKWHTDHALDHAGLFVRLPVEVASRELGVTAASHSTGATIESKVASTDGDFAELVPGETLSLSFKASQEPEVGRRSFLLVIEGHYVTLPQEEKEALPTVLKLHANSPNPFNPTTSIRFDLPQPGQASIRIYNVKGELVKTLANRYFVAGRHSVEWDGTNERGQQVSSGVYWYSLQSHVGRMSRRMVLLK